MKLEWGMNAMVIEVKCFPDLLRFINSNFECAYELVVLFTAVKFKDDMGGFDIERLVDFFMELFIILEKEGIILGKFCKPLQQGDRESVLSLLNENPINTLLQSKIFKTPERFNFDLFKEIFNNEEAVLVAIKQQLINFFLGRGIESRQQLEMILFSWEGVMNEMIKTNSLMRIVEGSYNKFTLEFLLKFLYQSYSLGAFEKLIADHQIDQKELIDYFNSRLQFPIERVGAISFPVIKGLEEEEPEVLVDHPLKLSAEERVKSLTDFFHKMREEEDEHTKKKKKKK